MRDGALADQIGAAQYCIDESVDHANARKPFGKPLSRNQAVQWPLVELQTECEMVRWLIRSERRNTASMKASIPQTHASRSASRCPATRRYSGLWWSSKPNARWCAG